MMKFWYDQQSSEQQCALPCTVVISCWWRERRRRTHDGGDGYDRYEPAGTDTCCRGLPCSLCGIVEAAADSGRNNSV